MKLRVVSLNIAHGRGTARHQTLIRRSRVQANLARVAAYLDEIGADIVCLQEADVESSWSGRLNHLEFMAERTGALRHIAFGPHVKVKRRPVGPLGYGNAILSRFPIADWFVTPFPLRMTGKKGFLTAMVETPEGLADVASLHLDFARSKTRKAQLRIVVDALDEEHERPLIVAGDFNACQFRHADLFDSLARLGLRTSPICHRAHATFPSPRPRRSIDHVWATAPFEFVGYEIGDAALSDHRPVVADLVWG